MGGRTVAFAADNGYIDQLTTAIKSLIYYNHDLEIDVLNTDIPQEWFIKMNNDYRAVNVIVNDIRIRPELLAGKSVSRTHIDAMTYARLLIPQCLSADRVIYLDSDLVVNGPLDKLFDLDLEGNLVGAVKDYTNPKIFNAGVLLIDNARLHQIDGLSKQWLATADQGLANDDQTILNQYFGEHYFRLPDTYNICLGSFAAASYYRPPMFTTIQERFHQAEPYRILHYDTYLKPWHLTSTGILREKWWQYYALKPGEVIDHVPLPNFWGKAHGNLWIATSSQDLQQIETLLTALPDYRFHITAPTDMGSKLLALLKYPNVRLYPNALEQNITTIMKNLDAYLDINKGPKDQTALQRVRKAGKPILSFDHLDVAGMVTKIKSLSND